MKERSQKQILITRFILLALQILLPLGLYFVLDRGSSLITWFISILFLVDTLLIAGLT
jgi:hypothetical protein